MCFKNSFNNYQGNFSKIISFCIIQNKQEKSKRKKVESKDNEKSSKIAFKTNLIL